jgi:tight adherence protein B
MNLPLIIGGAVGLAVILLVMGIRRTVQPTGSLEERIEGWLQAGGTEADRSKFDIEEALAGTLLGTVEEVVTRRDFAATLKEDLARADLTLTVTEYLLIRGAVIVVAFLIGFLLQRNLLVALVTGAGGAFLPTLYVRSRQSRRLKAFDGQLPDVLDHLQGSLRAGYGLLQAVEWVSRQIPDPAGMEFERVLREVQLGRTLLDALDSMVRRIPSDDLALIITAIKIQYEVGGSLAEVLETVSHTIRERVRIYREIRVLTSQQRYSGYVLIALPIGLAAFLLVVNPEYEMRLFEPGPTLCIPIGAVIMMVIGYIIMRKIVEIEV